jgi:hypothetical protein
MNYITDYIHPETGDQYAIQYHRTLTFDECAEALRLFAPFKLINGHTILVIVDDSWIPSVTKPGESSHET